MKVVIDTNVCIDVLRGRSDVLAKLVQHKPENCLITAISEFELLQGAHTANSNHHQSELAKVTRFLSLFSTIPFDSACAAIAAELNALLKKSGTPVNLPDVFIAACALSHDIPLVTNNAKDFKRIPRLTIFDWRQ